MTPAAGTETQPLLQSTRLIVNTVVTFVRMFTTVLLGLWFTRLSIAWLGAGDFGLVALLGASGGLILILSDSLTMSVQRHFAFEIGCGNRDALRAVFNTSLLVFLVVGAAQLLLGLAIAPAVVGSLEIPAARHDATWWVFVLTVATLGLRVSTTPYRAILMARQRMIVTAVFQTIRSVSQLIGLQVVASMAWFSVGHEIVGFAAMMVGVEVLIAVLLAGYCMVKHSESIPIPRLARRADLGRVVGFAGWSTLGGVATRLRVQGEQIILNLFYAPMLGTSINTAFALSSQVAAYQSNLSMALFVAAHPAVIAAEGSGDRDRMRRMVVLINKHFALLTLMFLVPVILETETLLRLWLGTRVVDGVAQPDCPPYTILFIRIAVIWVGVNWLSQGYVSAVQAVGKLRGYTLMLSGLQLASLAVAVVVCSQPGVPVWILPVISLVTTVIAIIPRVWFVGRLIDLSVRRWLVESLLPVLPVARVAFGAALAVNQTLPPTWWRTVLTTAATGLAAAPVIWWVALTTEERTHFSRVARKALAMAGRLVGRRTA